MTSARLGSIDFINSLPVDQGLLSGKVAGPCSIFRGNPSVLNRMMKSGELDLGPVSTLHYAEHSSEFLILPRLSISSKSGVRSVLFFSREPAENLSTKRIAVTTKGKTTPALLKLLFKHRWKAEPQFVEADESLESFEKNGYAGTLLIGDEALAAAENARGYSVYDLADEWRAWTGLPFVFAVWIVRRDFFAAHPELTLRTHAAILDSRAWGDRHVSDVVDAAQARTGLSASLLDRYFQELRHDFGRDLQAGLRRYVELAAEARFIPMGATFETTEDTPVSKAPIAASRVGALLDKATAGERISNEEGAFLFRNAGLFDLGGVANALCEARVPTARTHGTFVVDRNINYTNYCNTLCKFCAFYRIPGDEKEGYVRTLEEIFHKIDELLAIGGTQVLLQGGHNPEFGIQYYESLIAAVRQRYPQVNIHSLSASEIMHISKVSNLTVRDVLVRLNKAGLESLPGGGAEILVDRVRHMIAPLKTKVADYLLVHRTAHEIGMKSTGTMVYGLGETIEERMEHFDVYRKLQDETGGFRAFIPWSFESQGTELSLPRRTGEEYLRMIAVSRIMLDNFAHIQAGWVTEGTKLSQIALKFGADDFGGILMEENVVSATGNYYSGVTKEEAIRLIREAGKIPVQRNTRYETVKTYKESVPA